MIYNQSIRLYWFIPCWIGRIINKSLRYIDRFFSQNKWATIVKTIEPCQFWLPASYENCQGWQCQSPSINPWIIFPLRWRGRGSQDTIGNGDISNGNGAGTSSVGAFYVSNIIVRHTYSRSVYNDWRNEGVIVTYRSEQVYNRRHR